MSHCVQIAQECEMKVGPLHGHGVKGCHGPVWLSSSPKFTHHPPRSQVLYTYASMHSIEKEREGLLYYTLRMSFRTSSNTSDS